MRLLPAARWRRPFLACSLIVAVGCGLPDPAQVQGWESQTQVRDPLRESDVYDAEFEAAAAEFDVPAALLKSLAYAQTRYTVATGEVDLEGLAPHYGVMGLSGEILEQATRALGASPAQVQTDVSTNIRAGAAWLRVHADEAGIDRSRLASWRPLVERFSGLDNAVDRHEFAVGEVFDALRKGVGRLTVELGAAQQELEQDESLRLGVLRQRLDVAPDYPGGFWYPSVETSTRNGNISIVVIHTCEAPYASCRNYLQSNDRQVSAHYVVGEGEVAQLVREATRAHHIAATYSSANNSGQLTQLNGIQSNHISIGIEHGGYAATVNWPAAQLERSADLLCSISKRNSIPLDRFHVVGHGQLQPASRSDPGRNWPWASYIARAASICAAAPAAPTPAPTPATPAAPTTPENSVTPQIPPTGELAANPNGSPAASVTNPESPDASVPGLGEKSSLQSASGGCSAAGASGAGLMPLLGSIVLAWAMRRRRS